MSLLPIADIDTGERYRKDMGDLPAPTMHLDAIERLALREQVRAGAA